MVRHRLTDFLWEQIEEPFPGPAATGRPPVNPREMMDAIVWRLRTGSPRRDLPEEFGPWKTVYNHFDKWNSNGVLDDVKRRLLQRIVDADGIHNDLWCVDGTIIRAARCAAGGGKKGISGNPRIMHQAALKVVFPRKFTWCVMRMDARFTLNFRWDKLMRTHV